jgi:hypothetical protein
MGSDDFERQLNNFQETMLENHARFNEKMAKMQEAIAGLIQVARIHDEQIDQNRQQIAALVQQGKEQTDKINALIRIVEGHISNHP